MRAPFPAVQGIDGAIARAAVADFVLGAPQGSVRVLAGINAHEVRILLDAIQPGRCDARALLVPIAPALRAEAIIEQVLNCMAKAVRRLWPVWFTDVSFAGCRDDHLGRLAVRAIAQRAAEQIGGVSASWIEPAAHLALGGRPPRVRTILPATELAQLARAINRHRLIVVADIGAGAQERYPEAIVHCLEWISRNAPAAVVALCSTLPANDPPFDRILYGAARVAAALGSSEHPPPELKEEAEWIAPWRGAPHPLSEVERRLAEVLGADAELGPLFGFNQVIETVRGSRPRVDLVWAAGRLVVELDGYGSHGNRSAFMYDRQRDYELMLSGYRVLRLTNDEIAQDLEKAVEKIRDMVQSCHGQNLEK